MATSVTVIGWMTAVCVASGVALAMLVPGWTLSEVAAGMLGPLAAASATWWLIDRTSRVNPVGLTSVMMTAFFVKLVFFGAYVVIVLKALQVAPVPFIATFTAYFVGLYVVEAVLLYRLSAQRTPAAS